MLSRFARIALKSNARPFIGVSAFLGVGCGLLYARNYYPDGYKMVLGDMSVAVSTGVIGGCVGLGIAYGPVVSARLMGIDRFIQGIYCFYCLISQQEIC